MGRASEKKIRVVLGHPNTMSMGLLVDGFKRQSRFHMAGWAASTTELLRLVQNVACDVAVVHATLADGAVAGLGAIRQIRELRPEIKCVLFLPEPTQNLVVNAFRVGAKGVFCSHRFDFKMLCRCVAQVHAGQIWASSADLVAVMEAFSQLAPLRIVNTEGMQLLSKREEDVVRLLSDGFSNSDIAHELNLSEHTVKNYLFRIFDKLGVSSRVELVLYAMSNYRRINSDIATTASAEPMRSAKPRAEATT